uniref:Uncharacterized protein n=1 Tax=Lactuca sativa TaxID=4236 RepID=A0A9R1VLE4_LACSA|nr:hypothetical protein LSAT_V11C500274940 [Lactuca sativa]
MYYFYDILGFLGTRGGSMKSFESELHALTLRVSICNGWTRIKWRASKGSFLGLGGHSTRKHVSILSKVVGWRCCRREGEARELWGVIAVKVSHHSVSHVLSWILYVVPIPRLPM